MRWVIQVLSWLSTLVVARLVRPSDYGLMGMAMVYLGFVALINEFGIGSVIVQQRDLTEDQIARLGGLSVAVALFFFFLSLALAQPIALFFGEPKVRAIVMVLSLSFLTSALLVLPRALLDRELQFRRLALLDLMQALIQTVVTLAFAAIGFGYWALVISFVGSYAVATVIALSWRHHRIAWPGDLRSLTGPVRMGWHLVVSRVAWYSYQNADFAIVGRVLGKVALGTYTFGWTLATVPIERVSALVGRVAPATFSAVQNDRPALKRYLLLITEALAFITFPASLGLALTANDLVIVALGEEWRGAIMPLRILALFATYRSIGTILPHILVATRHTKQNMTYSLVALAVLPLLFLAGSRWGTAGVAFAWVVGYPIVSSIIYRKVFRLLDTSLAEYLRALAPATTGTSAMIAAVIVVKLLVSAAHPVVRLALSVLVGAGTYVAIIWVAHRDRVEAFRSLLREIRDQ